MLVDAVCTVCCSVIDVAFILDCSLKSQGQSAWTQMLNFVNLIIDRLTISQYALQVSFVSYGNTATIEFQFTQYGTRQSVKARIVGINACLSHTSSNLVDALNNLRNRVFQANAGARSRAPWVAVIVLDRTPTQNAISAASQARAASIQIIPVGVLGSGLNRNFLNQIAYTTARVTTVNGYNQLSTVAVQVADWICNSHLGERVT